MKQLIDNLGTGKIETVDVPCPAARAGHLLIRTRASLISAGTERMLVSFGKASLLGKARQQPERVRQVLGKTRTDGILQTVKAVRAKLDQALPLGYCNAGEVLEVGPGVDAFAPGDRVVSNGHHAEVVLVPKNLCAKIPDGVSDESAAFTVLGAVALQGIRLIHPALGEDIAVIGLGLIGLLTVQLLKANGCRVLGVDVDPVRCDMARQFGAETVDLSKGGDPLSAATSFSGGRGVDGVIIAASTASREPVQQAARMSRKRGRIVLVGVTGLELDREDFYEKELTFQVSCSYGPGRYDEQYEIKGCDYPVGFVRWTEQRNFEAVLKLMAEKKVDVAPLVSHRFPFGEAGRAYDLVSGDGESYLGIVLTYDRANGGREDGKTARIRWTDSEAPPSPKPAGGAVVGFIGAGDFAHTVLLPALKKTDAALRAIASARGLTSSRLAKKFRFETATTDVETIFQDSGINTVFIATRHDSHAEFVIKALEAGKHVFVEKPLCISKDQLGRIVDAYSSIRQARKEAPLLMVGFNRRFAPHVARMKALLDGVGDRKTLIMLVNAGYVPPGHWTQDPDVGGGRIVGEACHFVDLLRFLVGKPLTDVKASGEKSPSRGMLEEGRTIALTFEDGSSGTIHYLTRGHRSFPKERLEVFCAGRILHLDNFRKLQAYGWPGFKGMKLLRQDKGHAAEIRTFVDAVGRGGPSPIPFGELVEVTEATFRAAEALA